MSFLAWAFGLGALSIAFPILFHLIRPTPKGSQPFSSLMFLRESPPRISKRSRIDNWLLLLLRGLIILLLAAAFMRPFFRTGGEIFVNDMPGKRVAVLIDRSASMQRDGLWQAAKQKVDDVLTDLKPGDDVALLAFDDRVDTLLGFSDESVVDTSLRSELIRGIIKDLKPTWHRTNLGSALISAADQVTAIDDKQRSELGMQVIVISDVQKGSDIGALQTFVWPEDVRVQVHSLKSSSRGNATARVLPSDRSDSLEAGRRVRVTNSADSLNENFSVAWADPSGKTNSQTETSFYVPAGTSQVLRVPNTDASATGETTSADGIKLSGDETSFDNRFYALPEAQQKVSIACFTNDRSDDPKQGLYFLSRAIPETNWRIVTVDNYDPQMPMAAEDSLRGIWKGGLTPQMVVVTDPVSEQVGKLIQRYVEDGGTVVVAISNEDTVASLQTILPEVEILRQPPRDRNGYAMLASIDFSHPLFAPLSGPSFNDFTGIRFWNHTAIELTENDQTSVLARFDNSLPAVWQHRFEEGRVIGLASSWDPDNSQLALSTKFVPLVTSLLAMAGESDRTEGSYMVGERAVLPESEKDWNVLPPSGVEIVVPTAANNEFTFDQPGLYRFSTGNDEFRVAVNVDRTECQTEPMDADALASFDVKLGTQPTREEIAGSLKKLRDTQLENRQSIWKWLLVAAICLLILETLVASRKQSDLPKNAATT